MTSMDNFVADHRALNDSLAQSSGVACLPPSRIAMVIHDLRGGGAKRVALTISRGLLERGHHVDMIVFSEGSDYPKEMPEDMRLLALDSPKNPTIGETQIHTRKSTLAGYLQSAKMQNWQIFSIPSLAKIRRATRLAHYLDESKPDYIVAHTRYAVFLAQLASCMAVCPVPVIPVIHDFGRVLQNKWRRWRYWVRLHHAQKIIAVSRAIKTAVECETKISPSKIEIVYNGVPAGRVELLSRDRPDHNWLKKPGIPVVLGVGRLVPLKDWPTLMRAFCLLRKRMECRLVILGKGKGKRYLNDLSHQLGIAGDFDNPGFTDNPFQYMCHSSVMGLSSELEPLGMVLLEALACGCPCVSTDCGGPSEILANGRYGALVPVGDHEAMADALEQAIRNPPPRDVLQQRAKEFSVERCVTGYERVLASVAQEVSGKGR